MPGYVGFQLALELSNIFPLKEVVTYTGAQLLSIARSLRKSGSDLVVEEDLAAVFGRGRIEPQLEQDFKKIVNIQKFIPVKDGAEIVLQSGIGPTMSNALRDRRLLSTAIQLSLLAWTHNRGKLADLLVTCMRKRHEIGVPTAEPDPGVEGIMGTLEACSSQTSAFNWSYYTELAQEKLRAGIPTFQYSADYIRMTPALMLGAMDFLFMVQSLPEDRKIVVSNEIGSITIIVWAHYVLGLTVAIAGEVVQSIRFGDGDIQVTIHWSRKNADAAGELFYPVESEHPEPELRLLDKEMEVLLRAVPDADSRVEYGADDRHVLLGWGTTYLWRIFNTTLLTSQDDPIYEETVNLVTALAITCSGRLHRLMGDPRDRSEASRAPTLAPLNPQQPSMGLEIWRILNASRIMFHGLGLVDETTQALKNTQAIDSYVSFLRKAVLTESTLPLSFEPFLKRVVKGTSSFSPAKRLLDQVKYLAQIVLTVAHIIELEECIDMPLRITHDHPYLASAFDGACRGPSAAAAVRSEEIFHAVACLLSDGVFDARDDMPIFSSRMTHFLYLWSDFGWSVYLPTFSDKDPADIPPELIHVRKGVPTNRKTEERKLLIRDGTGWAIKDYPDSYPTYSGTDFLPRACATVSKRAEVWTARVREFESTLYFNIIPSAEWAKEDVFPILDPDPAVRSQATGKVTPFEDLTGYREMHSCIWQCYLTPNDMCSHERQDDGVQRVRLGPDSLTLLGYSNAAELASSSGWPQRVVIMLTKGDRRLRWLAVIKSSSSRGQNGRKMMLRTSSCCETCATHHTVSLPGKWLLVL